MSSYLRVINNTVKSQIHYRLHILMSIIVSMIPIISQIYLWIVLYANNSEISGYNFKEMITYTIIAKLMYSIILPQVYWEIQNEIRSGEVTKYFIRPISFIKYWFAKNLGIKIVNIIVSSILIIIIIIFRSYISFPSWQYFLMFLLSCFFSIILYFLIYQIISQFAFWFIEVTAFFFIAENIISFTSGALIPLDIMPKVIYSILKYLPFSKISYFPLNIFLQRISINNIIMNYFVQLFWIIFFYYIARVIYVRGVKKYEAHGG